MGGGGSVYASGNLRLVVVDHLTALLLRVPYGSFEDRFPVADGDGGGRHGMEALIRSEFERGREGLWWGSRGQYSSARSLERVLRAPWLLARSSGSFSRWGSRGEERSSLRD